MKVLEFLDVSAISMDLKGGTKPEVLTELCGLLEAQGKISDAAMATTALLDREKLGSTGIGQGIAIPHGKTDSVKEIVAALGISRKGIQFDALDGEPVYIVFLLLAPAGSAGEHLKALSRISRLLKDKFFRQAIKDARAVEDIHKIIREEDEY